MVPVEALRAAQTNFPWHAPRRLRAGNLVALGLSLEELERPKARERREETQFGSDGAVRVNGTVKKRGGGDIRTIVAGAFPDPS